MAPPLPDPTRRPSMPVTFVPPESRAHVALHPAGGAGHPDALGVVDVDPLSPAYGRVVERVALAAREELPHAAPRDPLRHELALALRPAHNPTRAYGFAGIVLSRADLSASVILWSLDRSGDGGRGAWRARTVITVPPEPADPAALPPALRDHAVVPPLVTDLTLSGDDRFLYVSCWGTGELRQYDVSDPFAPVLTGSVRLGGIAARTPHPRAPQVARTGGPHMVAVSQDGRRVYVTNAHGSAWDAQFYPEGVGGWMAKCETGRQGGLVLDPGFLCEFDAGVRPHRVRLEEWDAP